MNANVFVLLSRDPGDHFAQSTLFAFDDRSEARRFADGYFDVVDGRGRWEDHGSELALIQDGQTVAIIREIRLNRSVWT